MISSVSQYFCAFVSFMLELGKLAKNRNCRAEVLDFISILCDFMKKFSKEDFIKYHRNVTFFLIVTLL